MADVYKPKKLEDGWQIEVSLYPDFREIIYHKFEDKGEAFKTYDLLKEFYNFNPSSSKPSTPDEARSK